ncbi:hypothetical protein RhiXN_03432 [Rhizoctonia solani]|uniref:DUF4604 domain-containing protein n=1 Tax=Rhizoctonia solani TaxID=456999 RepID=A0A8H8SVU6_9AGAM|nr:uncharacterized protein RhiXN_03432 [Rhizoctonia solani]QRW18508.1 hypothetical protein RhiXN_03432 [Rhizoctonia solani]
MPPRNKGPTPHQISSRLQYSQGVPSFLRQLQSQVGGQLSSQRYGRGDNDDEPEIANMPPDEEDGNVYNPDWDRDVSSSGRPPIPSRPPIPTRPGESSKPNGGRNGTPSEDEEDSGDEKPQIVVLKEGKHLSAKEVEREKRRAQGLPDDESEPDEKSTEAPEAKAKPSKAKSSTFSDPHVSTGAKPKAKRKIIGDGAGSQGDKDKISEKPKKKKAKKETKLLSFGDGED